MFVLSRPSFYLVGAFPMFIAYLRAIDDPYPSAEVSVDVVKPPSGVFGPTLRSAPLVFVHGNSHGGDAFRGLATALAQHGYESHLLTMPKYRFKPLTAYVEDIKAYLVRSMDTSGPGPILIGHSMGGQEIQHFLLNSNPDLPEGQRATGGVFLASSAGHSFPLAVRMVLTHPVETTKMVATLNSAHMIGHFDSVSAMTRLMFQEGTTKTNIRSTAGEYESMESYAAGLSPVDTGLIPYASLLKLLSGGDKYTVEEAAVPTLTVAAENDGIVPRFVQEGIADFWGNKLEVIEGVGHCFGDPGWEEKVVPPLVAWLNEQTA